MTDPSRIPNILKAVEEVWLGQTDLNLIGILRVLENHGLDWNSTEAETLEICRNVAEAYPGKLGPKQFGFEIRTTSPAARFSLVDAHAIVRAQPDSAPAIWPIAALIRAEIGMPLRIESQAGHQLRFGVVTAIEKITDPHVTVCLLADSDCAIVHPNKQVELFKQGRREVARALVAGHITGDVLVLEDHQHLQIQQQFAVAGI